MAFRASLMVDASRERIHRCAKLNSSPSNIDGSNSWRAVIIRQVHKNKTRRIPELINEILVAGNPIFGQFDVATHGGHGCQSKPESIGAVFLHDVERVDDVPFRFGHLLPFFVAHQCMNVNVPKRDIIHELEPHHDHPRHPEKQNIETRDQGGGRVEALEIVRLMRPAEG